MAQGEMTMTVSSFRRLVWSHYKKYGRHDLPWRPPSLKLREGKKDDILYRVLVSEIMLQQTQVERVIPFYKNFIKQFSTAKKLAAAPLSEVLKAWQGLGYNRRAKMLHAAAKELATSRILGSDLRNSGPRSDLVPELEVLPGMGPYTARAVAAFAWNQNVIFVETNIRTAVIHHFFSTAGKQARKRKGMIYHTSTRKVSDTEIEEILATVLPKGRAREWYGAHLKRSGISHNAKSRQYTKQSKFSGSRREARGVILQALSQKSYQGETLLNLLGAKRRAQMRTALAALRAEKLIEKKGKRFVLAD